MKHITKTILAAALSVALAFTIIACGGGSSSDRDDNSVPVANAGFDQIVSTGSLVTLDGSGCTDADGDTLTHSWSFTSKPAGSTAALSVSNVVNPTFTADMNGAYVLSLTVNDGTVDSAADTVTITAATSPVASAGSDQDVTTGTLASLDGSASADPEGHALAYSWSFSSVAPGSALGNGDITNATTASPEFTPDVDGAYVVQLVVNDGMVYSPADTVTVTAWPRVLPDTGQTACYDGSGTEIGCAGTGEDGEYSINPMSYADKENGTVVDNVTGLMWQQENDGSEYNWYEASGTYHATYNASTTDVCGSLALGGYDDWRLPTKKELVSIVVYKSDNPTINTTYFLLSGSDPKYFWASTAFENDASGAWMVSFSYGSSGVGTKTDSTVHYVRCVRGGSIAQSFTDNGDGTVTDNVTGLMWQQTDDVGSSTWQGALDHCNGLSLADYDDWRLPNVREFDSMVDEGEYDPAINPAFTLNELYYWSSTSDGSSAWSFDISYGDNSTTSKGAYNGVLCVR